MAISSLTLRFVAVTALVLLAPAVRAATLVGTLQAGRAETLRSPSAGTVASVSAEPGQSVRRGAVLARIADPTVDQTMADARASVQAAQRAEEMATRSLADIQARAAQRELLSEDVDRARALLAATRDAVTQARARLATVEKTLGKREVRAPFDGVVGERSVEAGDTVELDASIVSVVDTSKMILVAQVAPDEVGTLKVGQPLDVSVTGYSGAFRGVVAQIAPAVDPGTGQVEVTAEIPNAGRRLVAGVHAEARPASRGPRR